MKTKNLEVIKFGGSSLSSPEKIHQVAKIIKNRSESSQILVVVSAMGKSTDGLIKLAGEVSPNFQEKSHKREFDMLVSVGERISMALLSMSLKDIGIDAISFTGSQAGIITSTEHSSAIILDIRPYRIEKELSQNKIVIVAGFQGMSEEKEITTLGRGGSDTSAIALANKLEAHKICIFSDVEGFYFCDPRICERSFLIKEIDYELAESSALWGSGVLHPRAIRHAKKKSYSVYCKKTSSPQLEGSVIKDKAEIKSKKQVFTLNFSPLLEESTNKNEELHIHCEKEDSLYFRNLSVIKDQSEIQNENALTCVSLFSNQSIAKETKEKLQKLFKNNNSIRIIIKEDKFFALFKSLKTEEKRAIANSVYDFLF